MSGGQRSIWDFKHVKSVTAISLMHSGKPAGKIIANFSDNPAGSVCTAAVFIWEGPLTISEKYKVKLMDKETMLTSNSRMAKASGYGYCKFSQAVGEALRATWLNGRGEGAIRKYFESEGYEYIQVI